MPTVQSLAEFLQQRVPPELDLNLPIDTLAALLIYQLIKSPQQVVVRCRGGDGLTAMEFDVGAENKGRVIGKHGHLIKALRSLCRSIERSRNRDVILDIAGWESSD